MEIAVFHYTSHTLTHYQTTNLDSSKLKEFAYNNFKFEENGRKLSKWVENTVGKGEIAHYEQFLLFPQFFQKACFPEASKGVIVWESVNSLPHNTNFQHFWIRKLLKILWEKEKMLVTNIFSFSNNVFYPSMHKFHFLLVVNFSSLNALNLDQSIIL